VTCEVWRSLNHSSWLVFFCAFEHCCPEYKYNWILSKWLFKKTVFLIHYFRLNKSILGYTKFADQRIVGWLDGPISYSKLWPKNRYSYLATYFVLRCCHLSKWLSSITVVSVYQLWQKLQDCYEKCRSISKLMAYSCVKPARWVAKKTDRQVPSSDGCRLCRGTLELDNTVALSSPGLKIERYIQHNKSKSLNFFSIANPTYAPIWRERASQCCFVSPWGHLAPGGKVHFSPRTPLFTWGSGVICYYIIFLAPDIP
jgi:hypothetical protein